MVVEYQKEPITQVDHEKNRYLVNSIDYKTKLLPNTCSEDQGWSSEKVLNFVDRFERHFNCRVQVLHIGGGGEYAYIDFVSKLK